MWERNRNRLWLGILFLALSAVTWIWFFFTALTFPYEVPEQPAFILLCVFAPFVLIPVGITQLVKGIRGAALYARQAAIARADGPFLAQNAIRQDVVISLGYRQFVLDREKRVFYITPGAWEKERGYFIWMLDSLLQVSVREGLGDPLGSLALSLVTNIPRVPLFAIELLDRPARRKWADYQKLLGDAGRIAAVLHEDILWRKTQFKPYRRG